MVPASYVETKQSQLLPFEGEICKHNNSVCVCIYLDLIAELAVGCLIVKICLTHWFTTKSLSDHHSLFTDMFKWFFARMSNVRLF